MEERKLKRKSPRTFSNTAAQTGGSGRKSGASSGGRHVGFSHNMGSMSGQKNRNRRGVRDKVRNPQSLGGKHNQNQGQAAPIIQHSFLTDVSDVQEMEHGLLSLLNDFHSGKLQAFGNECSIDQMEHVREMQEKLACLHFDLYSEVDEMPEDQRKMASDTNMDKLLLNPEAESSGDSRNLEDGQRVILNRPSFPLLPLLKPRVGNLTDKVELLTPSRLFLRLNVFSH
ncbi:coiled-coil domain-containing protein 28A isoform X1 [Girardinichthys multiradiatus]|uniref:coiled-coil domain-containing protein 28A isoform X1 n=1 Tax=Girardinichthys multiradiatus TaxID=208333 RepID=UPI001FAB85BF|nr:coiled-coil domain-containing protein 28A isoform X1 [Girardinichthys multiradiatus]XP_047210717.1 coiled-coil domain-containing protein 28A isoform X1 [Girardinichthys multiradiatus]